MPLNIKPCHLRTARDYVGRYHRHSIPPVGGKFAVACYDGDRLCGVAICGRPVARYLDDGLTLEILHRRDRQRLFQALRCLLSHRVCHGL